MPQGIKNIEGRATVRRLRRESRMSFAEIKKVTGFSKGSISAWLKDLPLSPVELEQRRSKRRENLALRRKKLPRGQFWGTDTSAWSTNRKGAAAEYATGLRLAIHGIESWRPSADGGSCDFLIKVRGEIKKLQVRWAGQPPSSNLPKAKLRCSDGRNSVRRWGSEDFDYLAVYDLQSDIVFVFSENELRGNKGAVTVNVEDAERWDKILETSPRAGTYSRGSRKNTQEVK